MGIWAGGAASSARAASRFHTCEKDGGLLCKCPNRDLFYQICCIPKDDYTCECKAPPNGYARCKPKCDDKCGDKCCKKGEYCASKPRSLCCREGEDVCLVLGTPGTAEKGAGGKCCPRGSLCCANDKRASCCGPQQTCSQGTCGCPSGKKKCGQRCCDKNDKCCDGKCCGAKETCCDGKCCGEKQTCCNGNCCDKDEKCCPERCCPKDRTCCGPRCCEQGETCCGNDCCGKEETCMATRLLAGSSSARSGAAIRRICCPKPRILTSSFCCPPGTLAGRTRLTKTCCPPSNPNCCGELGCAPGESCVTGTCGKR